MLETIERLLILQDCERKIRREQGELARIEPERQTFNAKAAAAQSALENARQRLKQIESARKDLELEAQVKKQMIDRYAHQQLLTRKNDEYRALASQIETCKSAIFELENQQIELMEQAEAVQKEIAHATATASDTRKLVEDQLAQLAAREANLRRELDELRARRETLAGNVEQTARSRYERLLRSKGENVLVGVQHGVCGGCHMKVPPQLLVTCQAEKELVACSNCGRMLYYTPDMDLAVTE